MEDLALVQQGSFQGTGNVIWKPWGQKGGPCRVQPLEGPALLLRWDLEVQATKAFKQEDDIIRCVL